jgi:hypothetical protein
MAQESISFYGFSFGEKFRQVEAAVEESLRSSGRADGPGFSQYGFSLAEYIEQLDIGWPLYLGRAFPQDAYIGLDVPRGERGLYVSDEIVADVAMIIENLPAPLVESICGVNGAVPLPMYESKEYWA